MARKEIRQISEQPKQTPMEARKEEFKRIAKQGVIFIAGLAGSVGSVMYAGQAMKEGRAEDAITSIATTASMVLPAVTGGLLAIEQHKAEMKRWKKKDK